MQDKVYDVGDGVRATWTARDLAGAVASPTTVVAKLKDPAGTVTTPTPTQSGTGVYYVDITLNAEGRWYVRFEGTGAVISAAERQIRVRDSQFY
jgi:hypothetical protein